MNGEEMKLELPSAEMVRATLRYEPDTGKLFWKHRPRDMFANLRAFVVWNKRYADQEALAGIGARGYPKGDVFGRRYSAHRIIWLMQTGEWPNGQIDHINGVRSDNRWENLRVVSHAENGKNQRMSKRNKSGVVGVRWRPELRRWVATIMVSGSLKQIGTFSTIEEAAQARAKANALYGFGPSHGAKHA